MTPALEAARAARLLKLAAGETIERLNPAEKARRNPNSLRLAINAKCFDCVGGANADAGFRRCIRECPSTKCALHTVRPFQRADEPEAEPEIEQEAA